MGYATKANRSLTTKTVIRLLGLVKQEAMAEEDHQVAKEYWKVGAAVALAVCVLLWGPEMLRLNLAGLREHIGKGREGSLLDKPLKTGVDLTSAPHVVAVLIGNFKGETGVHHHMIALASNTMSGITLRWWLEKLIEIRTDEGCFRGPAFGYTDGSVTSLHENDGILHHFLHMIQQEDSDLISEDEDVQATYSFFQTFWKTSEARARAAGLDSSVQNAMNQWRTIENAKGGCPCFNMIEHYSNA